MKRPLWICCAAACVGIVVLVVWFPKYWPAAQWTVLPKEQLIRDARDLSQRYGFDSREASPLVLGSLSRPLTYYKQEHPDDQVARLISPLSVKVKLAPKGGEPAEAGLDSAGTPMYWQVPSGLKPLAKQATSEREGAQQAFAVMAERSAPLFAEPKKSMGDDPEEENYVWKKSPTEHSQIREQITVFMRNTAARKVERKISIASSDEEGDSDEDQGYWLVASIVSAWLSTLCTIAVVAICILWAVRRSIHFRFPLTFAGVALVGMIGAVLQKSSEEDSYALAVFVAFLMLCYLAVGRGISTAARPKWMSLEQLCFLAPVSKNAGESLAAGLLCSPLLIAIPYLIVGSGLIPHSLVMPRNLEVLYSNPPMLDSLNIPDLTYSLAFFGFLIPGVQRMIHVRWLRWFIGLTLGTFVFANLMRVVTGPIAAPLSAGFLTLGLFGFLYRYFDLLAVLTLQLASAIVLSILELAQKGFNFGPLAAMLVVLAGMAVWFMMRGQAAVQGDPRAVVPELGWFRAEREKLQAEFSVARRAQEGMLPQTAPEVPGYSIAASCTPSLDVGGDLYDFLKLPDGRIGIAVADVSGKGVPAALYMTLTKGLLASVSQDQSELGTVMDEVNRHLHSVTRKKVFVTMALGILDAEKRLLQCARAGHNPVVWRQATSNKTTLVSPPGLGLGITAGRIFRNQLKVEELVLGEGDAVVFYSDGVTEAMNKHLEQFGEERLMRAVEATDHMDAAAAHDSILQTVRDFLAGVHPQDDMTLVVLRVG